MTSTNRRLRQAAQRDAALRGIRAMGCTCQPSIMRGRIDEHGIPHVVVAHDDDCRLCCAPTTLVVYRSPRCDR